MTRIGEAFQGRNNRFTPVRMVLASLVILEHVFVVAYGTGSQGLVSIQGWSPGYLAVNGFFILSGFLIAGSLERRQDLVRFVIARMLRLWPALIVLALAAVLIIGPVATGLSPAAYWQDPQTWLFIPNIVFFADTSGGPAAVFPDNAVPGEFSASLWTLRYEALAYAAAALLFFTRVLWSPLGGVLLWVAVSALTVCLATRFPEAPSMLVEGTRLAAAFLLGVAAYMLRGRIALTLIPLAALLPAAWLLGEHPAAQIPWNLALASIILWIGLVRLDRVPTGAGLPDWSYGVYIWHYPLFQLVWHWGWASSPLQLAILGIPVTAVIAAISWHIVEKPSLGLQARLFKPRIG
ncbi:acyltransferase [Maricaulis sp.]|uniref:acyltransferase family protein n=1 Tax=Maricaulis sp. TaxID=1486257 RepID=UPI00329997CB